MYELSHELPNDLRLKTLRNKEYPVGYSKGKF